MTYHERIKFAHDLTQKSSTELARLLGVSLPFFSNVEAGRTRMNENLERDLAVLAGIPSNFFRSTSPLEILIAEDLISNGHSELLIQLSQVLNSGVRSTTVSILLDCATRLAATA